MKALLLLLLAAAAFAQEPTILRLQSNLVVLPAQVEIKKGDILYGLKASQFSLEDNGISLPVQLEEDDESAGLSLVLVVQCSRTAFEQFGKMRGLHAMVDALTGGAPHQVALVSYGTEIELLTGFTASDKRLSAAFANLQPCDDERDAMTLDAVDFATHLFDGKPPASLGNRRAILLIGETRDHGSHLKPGVVAANLGRSNIVIDAVSFNPGKDDLLALLHGSAPNPLEALMLVVQALRKNVPHTLTHLTGGEYTNFNTQKGFEADVGRLANHIHNFYLLSFRPLSNNAPGLHRLTLKVPDYPDAQIRSRLTYYAGDAPPPVMPQEER